jgi:capsular exopolysaccharide synthesis family protein
MTQPAVGTRPDPPRTDELTLADVVRILYDNRRVVLVVMAGTLVLALAVTLLQRPVYQTEATMHVHDDRMTRSGLQSELGSIAVLAGLGRTTSGLETDMLIMQSRLILAAIADSLAMQVRLVRPAAARESVFSEVEVIDAATPTGTVTFRLRRDGRYDVTATASDPLRRLPHPNVMEPGVPARIGGVQLTLAAQLAQDLPRRIDIEIVTPRSAVTNLRRNLRVSQLGRNARIVSLQYRDRDPVLAAAVPNAVSGAFLDHKRTTSHSEARRRAEFLRDQVARYNDQLVGAEAELRGFREREQIISVPDQASEQVRRMAQLQARRDELIEERQALRYLITTLRGEDRDVESYRRLATFPVFFSNRAVQVILESLIDLENQRAQLSVRRTEQSIDIRGIDDRIQELELELLATATSYLENREVQLASVGTTLQQFNRDLGTIPAREVEFARLSRQQRLLAEIHGQLELRLREVEVEEAVEPAQLDVLDPALLPLKPASPRPLLNLFLGGAFGLLLGVVGAFGRQALDTRVRTREDVQAVSGGIPVLGLVPHSASAGSTESRSLLPRRGNGRGLSIPALRSRSAGYAGPGPLVARDTPQSPAAEAYREIRTRLSIRNGAVPPKLLVVTSAGEGEGKSTIAGNLAVSFAQQGGAILLCDADMRRGALHQLFGLPLAPGLADVLAGRVTLDEVMHTVVIDGVSLNVVTAGAAPANPTELLGGSRMKELAAELGERFARVIIDTPPLQGTLDPALLGTLKNAATLLVARFGVTDRGAVERASNDLKGLGSPVLGVVVTDVAHPRRRAYLAR